MKPTVEKDDHGEVVRSGIYTYGETVHIFVERKNYNGVFLPGYQKWESDYKPSSVGLKFIDHMVGNVGWNEMNTWVKWYEDVMGFVNFLSFDDKQIHTEYSALMSKVMTNGNFGTEVLANNMFREAFSFGDTGIGAALAMLIFISVVPIMFLNIRRMQRES